MRRVAITGSLASGKSTICSLFKQWGAYVIDADTILHTAFDRCHILRFALIKILGSHIIENDVVSRKRVADAIFVDEAQRVAVEDACHEIVFTTFQNCYRNIEENCNCSFPFFIAEVPLLFESRHPDLLKWFDTVVVVSTAKNIAQKRFMVRGGKRADFDRRERCLVSFDEKIKKAAYVIENNGNLQHFSKHAYELFQALKKN